MQVKDLTIDEFRTLMQEIIEETLQDLLLDPDIAVLVELRGNREAITLIQ